jgi:predicted transcriptional regulator of viral defense system
MHAWRTAVNQWLQGHHGVITVATMVELGCPRRTAYDMVERGELAVVLPGVLRSATWPAGDEQLMAAACARYPDAAVGFTSAARWWELRRFPRPRQMHLLLPHGHSPDIPGVVTHRSRRIDAVDVVRIPGGIRVTSPARTLFDCADLVGPRVTASALEQLIDRGHGTFATHLATFTRLAHGRRPGTRTMRRVLGSRPSWRAAMQSDLEVRVLDAITTAGLPQPTTQHNLRLGRSERIRIDFAWPDLKLALEVDHPFWHAGAEEAHRDKRRDRRLLALGWHVVRITDVDVSSGLGAATEDLAAVIRRIT